MHSNFSLALAVPYGRLDECLGACVANTLTDVLDCSAQSSHMTYIGWLLFALTELLLFIMVVHKYRQARMWKLAKDSVKHKVPDITLLMLRDSTLYFAL